MKFDLPPIDFKMPKSVPVLEKGIPCDHTGCRNHYSHPCEGCGRYAAGLLDGPDVDACFLKLVEYYTHDPTFYMIMQHVEKYKLTETQMLYMMLFAMKLQRDALVKQLTKTFEELISVPYTTGDTE